MRLLSGVSPASLNTTITGDGSLRRRPMRRVMDPLRQMGAEIKSQKATKRLSKFAAVN